jgi:transposase InsO family protein
MPSNLVVKHFNIFLQMAINNKPKQQVVLLHSDQGSTYRAYDYLGLFKVNNITQSMSRKGECYDNAIILKLTGECPRID